MLRLENVTKRYGVGAFGGRTFTAVRDVSFEVAPGEVVSLIGESGSGKSTIGKMILRLTPISEGRITLDGADIRGFARGRRKEYYRRVQGVFQDPFSCYNPIFKADRVLWMIKEEYFPRVPRAEWDERVESALRAVRLDPGAVLGRYPHQLSGGQLQRLLVARALLLDIRYLVADEITSMLDASTRIDVLNLLADLKTRGLGVLFITHDLALGNYIAAKTVVLRRGEVVEMGDTEKVFADPRHPYARHLLASVPQLHARWDGEQEERYGGCPVHEDAAAPEADGRAGPGRLVEVEPGHLVACTGPEGGCRVALARGGPAAAAAGGR